MEIYASDHGQPHILHIVTMEGHEHHPFMAIMPLNAINIKFPWLSHHHGFHFHHHRWICGQVQMSRGQLVFDLKEHKCKWQVQDCSIGCPQLLDETTVSTVWFRSQ